MFCQARPCEICGGQSGGGTGFSPVSVSCHHCTIVVFILLLLLTGRPTSETFEESNVLSDVGQRWQENYCRSVVSL
jgi:hypothetical protein